MCCAAAASITESSSSSSSSLASSSVVTSVAPSAVETRGWQQQPPQQQPWQHPLPPAPQQQQQQQQPLYLGGGKAFSAYAAAPAESSPFPAASFSAPAAAAAAAAGPAAAAAAAETNSLLGSEVFVSARGSSRLGRGVHLPQRQQQRISRRFQLYAKSVDSYKAIARKELLEIYRICRREDWPLCAKWQALLGCMGTNVAASAVLSFVRQQLLSSSSSSSSAAAAATDAAADPLLLVTDGLLVLLKLMVDLHRNKRPPVVDLLGRLFVCGGNRGEAPALAEKRMEYAHTDRSICRFFLSELLRLCGPPFASYFCLSLLRLIAQVISTEKSAFRGSEAEGRRLRTAALSFVEQTLRFCDAPSPVPADRLGLRMRLLLQVAELAQAVRLRLLALPQEEA
ncbi:hypothetical protein ETH_00010400 [Eimeria tenella]|uniref:Uncharacterized protein n=1 Tax=Eimeria tenella TaxID=5802 RepID=U6L791_EIMTE|nr:hypothetical protein ETH_00010400 [Eimeria tenella]CDJ43660.1 hypothetical protein ETH_00010400 [Eimeria tenella]|eukprot:XP_013234409.1 hypothetical protein ETH_00010400 [Eimeria tenella]